MAHVSAGNGGVPESQQRGRGARGRTRVSHRGRERCRGLEWGAWGVGWCELCVSETRVSGSAWEACVCAGAAGAWEDVKAAKVTQAVPARRVGPPVHSQATTERAVRVGGQGQCLRHGVPCHTSPLGLPCGTRAVTWKSGERGVCATPRCHPCPDSGACGHLERKRESPGGCGSSFICPGRGFSQPLHSAQKFRAWTCVDTRVCPPRPC